MRALFTSSFFLGSLFLPFSFALDEVFFFFLPGSLSESLLELFEPDDEDKPEDELAAFSSAFAVVVSGLAF